MASMPAPDDEDNNEKTQDLDAQRKLEAPRVKASSNRKRNKENRGGQDPTQDEDSPRTSTVSVDVQNAKVAVTGKGSKHDRQKKDKDSKYSNHSPKRDSQPNSKGTSNYLKVKKNRSKEKKSKSPDKMEKTRQKENVKSTRVVLANETAFKGFSNEWKITKFIGSGRYGNLYDVQKRNSPEHCTLKTEAMSEYKRSRLKKEQNLLKCLFNQKNADRVAQFFPRLIDYGRFNEIRFIVVTTLGPNLVEIRKILPNKQFSKETALYVAVQVLTALEFLHLAGYVHRDIRPQNFAVGLGKLSSKVYLRDISIVRQYYDESTSTFTMPRANLKCVGTLRYASRSAMAGFDVHPRDDLESWMYLTYELFHSRGLPWKNTKSKEDIMEQKQKMFLNDKDVQRGFYELPNGMRDLLKFINKLDFLDRNKANELILMVMKIAKNNEISYYAKPDWVGKVEDFGGIPNEKDENSEDMKPLSSSDDEENLNTLTENVTSPVPSEL